ncbi:MAG: SEC-C metal-binding domain-containing protein [Candidatus Aminicenantales bacterium]
MLKIRPKIPISKDDLIRHLNEQLHFLKQSAISFDSGFEGEAKRLAVDLRILLYDSKQSTSLLGQLGMKNQMFIDSAVKYDPNNLLGYGGLVCIAMESSSPRYIAMLDDTPEKLKEIDFDQWWNNPVFVDTERRQFSRGQLILFTTNQDGGAHVDPKLDEAYSIISKKGGLGWIVQNAHGNRPLQGPERAAIRQIAHETLKSLIPTYSKKQNTTAGLIFGGVSVTTAPPDIIKKLTSIKSVAKVGRNEPCPCGSGTKYKKCHGKGL